MRSRRRLGTVLIGVGVVVLMAAAPGIARAQDAPAPTESPQSEAPPAEDDADASVTQDQTPDLTVLSGLVILNGRPAGSGVGITIQQEPSTAGATGAEDETARSDDDGDDALPPVVTCGSTTTDENGAYELELPRGCRGDEISLFAVLQRLPERRAEDSRRMPSGQEATWDLRFALTEAELEQLTATSPDDGTDAVGTALLQQRTSVFAELERMALFLLLATVLVLGAMVIAMARVTRMRYDFTNNVWNNIYAFRARGEIEALMEGVKVEGQLYQSRLGVFRWMVEGMVMAFVVIAILALGSAGKISDEGIVSILAALVGYAAGRVSSGGSNS